MKDFNYYDYFEEVSKIKIDFNNPEFSAFKNKDDALLPAKVLINPPKDYHCVDKELQRTVTGMAVTNKGRIYTSYFTSAEHQREDAGNHIMIFTSDDDAKSFDLKMIIEPPFYSHTRTYDSFPWIDDRGRLYIFYTQSYGSLDGREGVWEIHSDNPDDYEPLFTAPRRIFDGVVSSKPIIKENGDWLFVSCIWDARIATEWNIKTFMLNYDPKMSGTNVYISKDKGETFDHIANVKWAFANFPEANIVELSDGTIKMMIRGMNCVGDAYSYDGGYTWTIPHQNRKLFLPDTKFSLKRLKSGNLLLVCNYKSDMYSYYVGRNNLTAMISKDDGVTWKDFLVIDKREGSEQPDIFETKDGTIYISYGRAPCFAGESLLCKITEEDIFNGKLVNPYSKLQIIVGKAGGIKKQKNYSEIVDFAHANNIEL